MSLRALPAVMALLLAGGAEPIRGQAPPVTSSRAMEVDDLFTIERVGGATLSPDGKWLAVVIQRPMAEDEVQNRGYLWGNERADVWLLDVDGEVRRNLTNGAADGSGHWNPVWSPDGGRLAWLSTRGGDNVRLFTWAWDTDSVRRLSSRPVDLEASVHQGAASEGGAPPFLWLSGSMLLFVAIPDTAHSVRFDVVASTPRIAERAWAETRRGETAQVSVIESPIGFGDPPVDRSGSVIRLDAGDGASEMVVARLSLAGASRTVVVSPGQDRAAIAEAVFAHPTAGEPFRLRDESSKARVGVVSLDGGGEVWWVDRAPINPGGFAWAPDGETLALIGQPSAAGRGLPDDKASALFLVSPRERTVVMSSAAESISVQRVEWANAALPLVYGHEAEPGSTAGWWGAPTRGTARLLTQGISSPSSALVRLDRTSRHPDGVLFVHGDGDLWSVDPTRGGKPTNATASFPHPIQSVVWPHPGARHTGADVIVETDSGARGNLFRLDMTPERSGGPRTGEFVPRPEPDARLLADRPTERLAVFGTFEPRGSVASPTSSDGPAIWAAHAGEAAPRMLIRLNQQLDGIIEPEIRFIRYRGLDGDSLMAAVALPVGYREGVRYPVVTMVYAGWTVTDTTTPPSLLRKSTLSALNLQPLTGRGYVVMMPSMPLPVPPARGDPYLDLMKGVIPAVDKLIDLGIADAGRLAVMGQSYGGFSTYGLITQTTRFAAAVALAGPVDWVSTYGIFDGRSRYTSVPQHFALPGIIEGFQPSLGHSPWDNLWAYLRNSPLYYLDRVETPIMIIQGDLDYVPMAQGELAFTAMLRMGKRATFVRYWGEEHVLASPANIRDMWTRILAWFDDHLLPEPAAD